LFTWDGKCIKEEEYGIEPLMNIISSFKGLQGPR
jgi:hypothetical protein